MVPCNYRCRYWKRMLFTQLCLSGLIYGTAGCDHDQTAIEVGVGSHAGHHHHRHLNDNTAEFEPCGFEEPSPTERLQDQLNMLIWSFDRNTDPDAPPINYTIPVYFHILQPNSSDLVLDNSTVAIYMSYLSSAFTASGAPFRFPLMGITRTINATISNDCKALQSDYKPILKRGGKETLNVYVCNQINSGRTIGFSSYPSANPGTNDGVTLARTTPTDLNRPNTFVHEVGHYIGLHHTFIDNCTTTNGGDLVDDTPYHVSLASAVNCRTPVSTWDTCPTLPGLDPVDNYMTYTIANHECRTKFTPGQVDRMKAQFEIYRYIAPQTTPPTKAPTKQPTKEPTKQPTKAPTKQPTKAPTKHPIKAPTNQPTRIPIDTSSGTPIRIRTPTLAPTASPAAAPVITSTNSPATTSAPFFPISNSPAKTTSPTTTPVSLAPNAPPITAPPTISQAPEFTSTLTPVPILFTAAPIAPKCKFYFSLCDANEECCGGVCRSFLGMFPPRCSIFININQ